ncbi:hypothetical protein V3G39_03555 [Dermatophilaceae bacterium Sec6.4]
MVQERSVPRSIVWATGIFVVGSALIILLFLWLNMSMAFIVAPLIIVAVASYSGHGFARKGQ